MIEKRGDKWCVLSRDGTQVLEEHPTREKAIEQMQAIEDEKKHTLQGVEIFSAGTHNGDTYTEADLDEIVNAFSSLDYIPPIKSGHSRDTPGLPALGWIGNLRRLGTKLVADFVDMPTTVYNAVKDRRYDHVSSEIYWNIERGGKKFRRALKAVALLGAEIPAVAWLKPLHEMFNGDNMGETHAYEVAVDLLEKPNGDTNMSTQELEQKLSAAQEAERQSAERARKAEEEAAAARTKLAELEAADRAKRIDEKINAITIPALRPFAKAVYEAAASETKEYAVGDKKMTAESALDAMVAELNKAVAPLLKTFSQHTRDDGKAGEITHENAAEVVDNRVAEYRAKDAKVTYAAAMRAVLDADPELKAAYAAVR